MLSHSYPTKEQILDNITTSWPPKEAIDTLSKWKEQEYDSKWVYLSPQAKSEALFNLLLELEVQCGKRLGGITIASNTNASYNSQSQHIYLNADNPSIISTLHEFGHHLRGSSEHDACSFSVGLFIKVFPKQYKLLKWRGHMLVRT